MRRLRAPWRDAHAAAHHDAVHERDVGLGVAVDQVVEGVFLGEEVLQPRIAGQRGLVEEADVAAGAEGAERAFLAHAAHRDRLHARVVAPGQQRGRQLADHVQRQRVQRLGPVQGDAGPRCRALRSDALSLMRPLPPSHQFVDHQRADHQRAAGQHGLAPAPRRRPTQASRMPKITSSSASSAISGAFSTRAQTTDSTQGIASCTRPSKASRPMSCRVACERQGQRQRGQRRRSRRRPARPAPGRRPGPGVGVLHDGPVDGAGQRHAQRHQRAGELPAAELRAVHVGDAGAGHHDGDPGARAGCGGR